MPYNAVYFNQGKAGRISDLICPPYDVISIKQAEQFRLKSQHNAIWIEFNDKKNEDFHAQSARRFNNWLEQGILVRANRPGIYFYEQEFEFVLGGEKRKSKRRGFFALLGLSEYEKGEVLRHEHTLKAPKEDRLKLLKASYANFSPIFVLYSDPGLALVSELSQAISSEPVFEFEDEQGFRHRLFGIYDERIITRVRELLSNQPVYIADGHHRYETGLAFYQELAQAGHPLAQSAGWILSYFCPIPEPGLIIFPYHRLVRNLLLAKIQNLRERIAESFEAHLFSAQLHPGKAGEIFKRLSETPGRVMMMMDSQARSWLLKLKSSLLQEMENKLDVEILEELILARILMISRKELFEENFMVYETDEVRVIERMIEEKFQLGFLLKPISINSVIERAKKGLVMPEKSTYFYPKLPTGLTFRKLAFDSELK